MRTVNIDAHFQTTQCHAVSQKCCALNVKPRHKRKHHQQKAGRQAGKQYRIPSSDTLRQFACQRHADKRSDTQAQQQQPQNIGLEPQLRLDKRNQRRPRSYRKTSGEKTDAGSPKFSPGNCIRPIAASRMDFLVSLCVLQGMLSRQIEIKRRNCAHRFLFESGIQGHRPAP